jgi:hypothetical protein
VIFTVKFGQVESQRLTSDSMLTLTGSNTNDLAGSSVSSAGDFNGDGIDDLIVSAPNYDNDYGGVFVVYGSGTIADLSNIILADMSPDQGFVIPV